MDRQAGRFCAELAWLDLIEKVSRRSALFVLVRRGQVEESELGETRVGIIAPRIRRPKCFFMACQAHFDSG